MLWQMTSDALLTQRYGGEGRTWPSVARHLSISALKKRREEVTTAAAAGLADARDIKQSYSSYRKTGVIHRQSTRHGQLASGFLTSCFNLIGVSYEWANKSRVFKRHATKSTCKR